MRYILFLVILLCVASMCNAQSIYQFNDSTRTFTTTPDTLKVSSVVSESFALWIYNTGSDTLLLKTDLMTKWIQLPPGMIYTDPTIYMKYLYRKAAHTSTTSNASGS
jgi:hypothetical protein